jgi:hypothetical protein
MWITTANASAYEAFLAQLLAHVTMGDSEGSISWKADADLTPFESETAPPSLKVRAMRHAVHRERRAAVKIQCYMRGSLARARH